MKVLRDIDTGRLVCWWNPHNNDVSPDEHEPFSEPIVEEGREIVEIEDEDADAFSEEAATVAGVTVDEGAGSVYLHADSTNLESRVPRGQNIGNRKIGGYSLTVDPPGERVPDISTEATLEILVGELKRQGATSNTPLRLADIENIIAKTKSRRQS